MQAPWYIPSKKPSQIYLGPANKDPVPCWNAPGTDASNLAARAPSVLTELPVDPAPLRAVVAFETIETDARRSASYATDRAGSVPFDSSSIDQKMPPAGSTPPAVEFPFASISDRDTMVDPSPDMLFRAI